MSKLSLEIENILNLIYSNKCSNNDIAMLFVYLRDLDKSKGLIWEIGSFFPHPNRNIGSSHKLIDTYIKKIIEVSANGGTIQAKRLADKDSIIMEAAKLLKTILFSFDEIKFKSRKEDIITRLFEKLDGIEFKFGDPKIKKCFLRNNDGKILFCFNLILTQGLIRIGPGALWCCTLFD